MSQEPLIELRRQYAQRPVHPALEALAARLRERHGEAVAAILFYGSCLRGGDPFDGLVDLYVIVDRYRAAYRGLLPALFNWLYARGRGGQFLLRIEDTDRARSTPEATAAILEESSWPLKVIILTTFDPDEYVYRALQAGASVINRLSRKEPSPTSTTSPIWTSDGSLAM